MRRHVECDWSCLCGHCCRSILLNTVCVCDPPLDHRIVQKKTTTDTWKSRDRLTDKWAKWLQNFLMLDGPSIDEILNTLNPTTGKRNTNIREVVTMLFGHWNASEGIKFINAISPQFTGITVMETCLLISRQTVTAWILCNPVERLLSLFFSWELCTSVLLRNPWGWNWYIVPKVSKKITTNHCTITHTGTILTCLAAEASNFFCTIHCVNETSFEWHNMLSNPSI